MKIKIMTFFAFLILLVMPFTIVRAEEDYNYYPEGWDIKQVYSEAKECGDFQYNYWESNGTAHIVGYTGTNIDLIIPDTIDGHPVVDILPFLYRKVHIRSITYGENYGIVNGQFITDMFETPYETEAVFVSDKHPYLKADKGILYSKDGTILYECPANINMEKLILPDSVTYVRSGAFAEAHTLKEIDFGKNGLINNLNSVFVDSLSIETVYLYGVKSISGESFLNCKNLKTLILGDTLEAIGSNDPDAEDDSCFSRCTSLTRVDFPKSLEVIGNISFSGCQSLDTISLPKKLKFVGSGAFRKCGNIGEANIPRSCSYIGRNAFKDCANVSLKVPSFMDEGGYGASYTARMTIGKESIDVDRVYKIGVRGGDKTLEKGKTYKLKLKAWYKGISYTPKGKLSKYKGHISYSSVKTGIFSFKSSDPSIVSVNKYGKLKANKAGTVTITITAYPKEKLVCTCHVTVK